MTLFLTALGGAIGAVLRYLGVKLALRLTGPDFPWGVFAVNILGSFIMGLAAALILERLEPGRLQIFLMTGVLGGFTTFSAFSLDAVALLEEQRYAAALGYVGGSVGFAIAALGLGLLLGRAMT